MVDRSSDPVRPRRDSLSEVLRDLRLSEASYGRCDLTTPWGIEFPPQQDARFHFVADGACWLRVGKDGPVLLQTGDVVLLPRGTGHSLSDSRRGRTKTLDELPLEEIGDRTYLLQEGGGGRRTTLVCSSVSFEEPTIHPLLELMPTMLLVRKGATEDSTLPTLLDVMAGEINSERVGNATVMTRLADVVIARVVRAWVESRKGDTTGWLAAIRDPKIGRALAAMHREPGNSWPVEALAKIATTSRSLFSERFTAVVGASPARYLARWRMHLARHWLRKDRLTVAEVAAHLGYESEAAFSRAFKRYSGQPPSAFRTIDPQVHARAIPSESSFGSHVKSITATSKKAYSDRRSALHR
jgi:AraC-like DNA-binding protein